MVMNLFSIFDPTSSILNLSLGWVSLVIPLVLFVTPAWGSESRSKALWSLMVNALLKESSVLFSRVMKPSMLVPLSFFFFIMGVNVMGLLPYVFTGTSHLTSTIGMSLVVWLMLTLYSWLNKLMSSLAHLVPQGTPYVLMPFMVLIESISNVIRPLTLAVRLSANMVAGHLLIALVSGSMSIFAVDQFVCISLGLVLLMVLEIAVALIQAYVFCTLTSLYLSEV